MRGQGHTKRSNAPARIGPEGCSPARESFLKAAHAFAAGAAKGQVLEPVPFVPLRAVLARVRPAALRFSAECRAITTRSSNIEAAVIDNLSARQNAPRRAITSFNVIKMIFRSSPTLRVRT